MKTIDERLQEIQAIGGPGSVIKFEGSDVELVHSESLRKMLKQVAETFYNEGMLFAERHVNDPDTFSFNELCKKIGL